MAKTSTEAGLSVHPAEDLGAPPANFIDLVTSYVVPNELYFCDCLSISQPLRLTNIRTGRYAIIGRPGVNTYVNYPDLRLRMVLPTGVVRVRQHDQKFLVTMVDPDDYTEWLECNKMMGVAFTIDDDSTVGYYYRAINSAQLTLMRLHQLRAVRLRNDTHAAQAIWGWKQALTEVAAREKPLRGGMV